MKIFMKFILPLMMSLITGFFLGVWVQERRVIAEGVHCSANLGQIDTAKTIVTQRLNLKEGEEAPIQQIADLCKGGMIPKCPSGGKYALNPIGKKPKCSLDPDNCPYHRIF